MSPRYYDRAGNPLKDIVAWTALHEDPNYARVAWTETPDVIVSTVWLGIDHSFIEGAPPAIFETMIFGGTRDGWHCRYATEANARAGHAAAVAAMRQPSDA